MDVKLINPFIGATRYIFNVMLGLKIDMGMLRATKDFVSMQDKVAAVIPMRGGVDGALILLFPKDKVVSIARVLDDTVQSVEDSMDALGELANIITGNAKKEVSSRLVEITTPTITIDQCGENVTSLSPWVIIPFESSNCTFDLLISFKLHDPYASDENQSADENNAPDTRAGKSSDDSDRPADEKQNPDLVESST